jgi:hypothetical protein
MVVYSEAKASPSAVPIVKGLTPDNVDVSWTPGPAGAPDAVHVSIQNYKVDALFGVFEFSGRPSVEFPFIGRYAPSEQEP